MITALILSGGTGTRLGADIPKQYIVVNGRLKGFSKPGANRQLSIFNGIEDIRGWLESIGIDDKGSVLVHDAARPMLSEELIGRCVEGA